MTDLIIRKRNEPTIKVDRHLRKYELQLRYVGPVETEYSHIAYLSREDAIEIIESTNGAAYFLYPEEHPYHPHTMEKHEDGTEYPEPTRGFEPWIGVDWDATLVEYHEWQGPHKSGKPIEKMVKRIEQWLAEDKTVKIITARVGNQNAAYASYCVGIIHKQLEEMGLPKLEVTATKDFAMLEMWDDRCISVVPNTGMTTAEYLAEKRKDTEHHEAD